MNAAVAKAMVSAQDHNLSLENAVRQELKRLFERLISRGFSPYTSQLRNVFNIGGGTICMAAVFEISERPASAIALSMALPLLVLGFNVSQALTGRAVTNRMRSELTEWFAPSEALEQRERFEESVTRPDILLRDLSRSPIDHYFVASDLTSGNPVYLGAAGLSEIGGDSHLLEMTISEAAAVLMTFPGYLLPHFANPSIGERRMELVDGGLYDNLALSCFLALPLGVDYIVAVDAGVVRRERTHNALARLRQLARSLASLHVRSTEQYAGLLATQRMRFERLRLPSELRHKTTLGSLGVTKALSLRLAGRNALEQLLDAGFLDGLDEPDSTDG